MNSLLNYITFVIFNKLNMISITKSTSIKIISHLFNFLMSTLKLPLSNLSLMRNKEEK